MINTIQFSPLVPLAFAGKNNCGHGSKDPKRSKRIFEDHRRKKPLSAPVVTYATNQAEHDRVRLLAFTNQFPQLGLKPQELQHAGFQKIIMDDNQHLNVTTSIGNQFYIDPVSFSVSRVMKPENGGEPKQFKALPHESTFLFRGINQLLRLKGADPIRLNH